MHFGSDAWLIELALYAGLGAYAIFQHRRLVREVNATHQAQQAQQAQQARATASAADEARPGSADA